MRYRIICLSALLTLVFVKSFAVNNLNNKVEFRAAWIATVANIDWPLAGCTDTDKQQQHMIQLLDSLQRLNFIKVIWSRGLAFLPVNKVKSRIRITTPSLLLSTRLINALSTCMCG